MKAPNSLKLTPHPLLKLLPDPLPGDVLLRRERVHLYGQRDPIEVFEGKILSGLEEYRALQAEKIDPKIRTLKAEPPNPIEYILRRHLTREVSGLDRGCIGVLAYRAIGTALGRLRMSEGAKQAKAGKKLTDPWTGKRWYDHAAKLVGVTPGCVKNLALINNRAPDVFDAVRARRLGTLHDARSLWREFEKDHGAELGTFVPNPNATEDRKEALRRYEETGKAKPIKTIIHDMRREKRIAKLPSPTPKGKDWAVFEGRMEDHAPTHPGSVDLVVADILYGEEAPGMAREVAKIARRVLIPEGEGVLALMAGQILTPEVIQACLAEGLHWLAMGFIEYEGGGKSLKGVSARVDCDPVLFFSTAPHGSRKAPLLHLKFTSNVLEKSFFTWQKPLTTMTSLIQACMGQHSGVILDPCCGSGTTLEAAIRLGHRAIGIEVDPERAKIAQSRMVEVEGKLSKGEGKLSKGEAA